MVAMMLTALMTQTRSTDQGLSKEIQGVYARWNNATAKGDVKTVLSMIRKDFKYITTDGEQKGVEDFPSFSKRVANVIANSRNMKFHTTVERVVRVQSGVVAWTSYGVSADFKSGEKWVHFEKTLKLVDTFVKAKSGWQIVESISY